MTPRATLHVLSTNFTFIACPNPHDSRGKIALAAVARLVLCVWCAENMGHGAHEIVHVLMEATRESLFD